MAMAREMKETEEEKNSYGQRLAPIGVVMFSDVKVEEPHRSQPLFTLTKPTRMASKSQRGITDTSTKEVDSKFLRNQRYARKHTKKNSEATTEKESSLGWPISTLFLEFSTGI